MTGAVKAGQRAQIETRSLRTDRWWRTPLITFCVLGAIIVYLTWAVFQNGGYYFVPYLSPMDSPCVSANCPADIGWGWFPSITPASPAFIVVLFPMGFRVTCYYYRKAYYRSFWAAPPACAVAEPHRSYAGESRFPLIVQNIHRYFWYMAVIYAGILTYDVALAFRDHQGHWGHAGFGTLLMFINIVLIWLYTLGCHSCRHITAGRLKHFSRHPLRYRAWTWVSWLNARHMQFAWASLTTVTLTDIYIRLLSAGFFNDPRFW